MSSDAHGGHVGLINFERAKMIYKKFAVIVGCLAKCSYEIRIFCRQIVDSGPADRRF